MAPDSPSVELRDLTTLRLGGPADGYLRCESVAAIMSALAQVDADGTPAMIVGGGSNVVVADAGFRGTAVHITAAAITISDDGILTAEAGAAFDDVVAAAVGAGFGGLECLSGVPGSVGATPVQNVGAYGVEVGDWLAEVQILDRDTGITAWVAPDELGLGYRTSILKGSDRKIVLAVRFSLDLSGRSAAIRYPELATSLGVAPGESADPAAVRAAVLALRRAKGMVLDAADYDTWSVGSFFTNPIVAQNDWPEVESQIHAVVGADARVPHYPSGVDVKLSAAWLIERAGFTKGYPGGDAPIQLSSKHALALTNRGSGTTAELLALAREIRAGVHTAFGVTLHPEPVLVGVVI